MANFVIRGHIITLNEIKIFSISFQTRQGRRYEMVPDQIRWYHSQQRKVNFLGTNNLYGALHIVSMKVNKRCVRLMLYHF